MNEFLENGVLDQLPGNKSKQKDYEAGSWSHRGKKKEL